MDTNHRGGPTGFLRVASNNDENHSESATVLCWPEYSGNRLYQTLGNLAVYPKAGLCIPDFDTGDCLYVSGTTEILVGSAAEEFLPHSKLCVKFFVVALRLVEHALPFRGVLGEKSIYHPRVRRLAVEKFAASPSASASASTGEQQQQQATLLHQTKLTPTISRFRFRLHQPNTTTSPTPASTYQPGQYITLDFSSHLNIGYSHMRDDDPRSLNDDFVRTFTVSGFYQQQHQQHQQKEETLGKCGGDEFEITIRKVGGGVVTNFLFGYGDDDDDESQQNQYKREKEGEKEHLVIDVRGFGGGGGEFTIFQQEEQEQEQHQQDESNSLTPTKTESEKRRIFIAAGIGITPIIPFLSTFSSSSSSSFLDLNLKILWTVKMEDLAFVWDVVGKVAKLELGMDMEEEGLSKKKKEKEKGIKFVVFVTGWKNKRTDDDDDDNENNEKEGKEEKKAKAIINRLTQFPEIVDAVYFRRMGLDDVNYLHRRNNDGKEKEKEEKEISTKYYLCTGEKMKREVMGWLSKEGGGGGGGEKEVVVVEDFTF